MKTMIGFITLSASHALNASMFELASGYAREGMTAYSRLQQHDFELSAVSDGESSTLALVGSTEEAQF
jgi:isocitrate/methylisocitrate lyase